MSLVLLNLLLVCITAGTLFFANRHFLDEIRERTLESNSFLTTEWRLLQEMKTRTDNLLAAKDREIAELRIRYETLQLRKSSKEILDALEAQIRQAEAERANILSIKFTPTKSRDDTSDIVEQLDSLAKELSVPVPSPEESISGEESAVIQLLRSRISALELEIETENTEKQLLLESIASLSSSLDAAQLALLRTEVPEIPQNTDLETILKALESEQSELAGREPVLSIADVRTRSLMRAIVRTPAIRSEYPDLADSLDRYFDLYGEAERLRGKQEAYGEVVEMIQGMDGS